MSRRVLLAGVLGVMLGGWLVWQWQAWRVFVAEGLRDKALMAADKTAELCWQHKSQWPPRRQQ